ncbi:FAD dependent oxidoreductase [Hortaea werneckii]|nr:FAD dependent oxidoreductase [Hortaea werneckii]KAI7106665.1 FAD dependent oxidoreductase [Hortaea werneckii]KAI7244685.1 FAD dependent oxidoreductase [Hortaea werneckii]KAI7330844.1 FAD dependent oxidoreductase [Hortaea werneckii]KAI7334820.1 FAD dependent oxidoreductase [Hortaea werneckii]
MAPHATTDDEPAALKASLTTNGQDQDNSNRSLPFTSPCLSYWHRTTRAWPHLNENHDHPVPSQAKYCIIGSGLSGALTAWELVESGVDGRDIVVLEAREAVSGASGRNAGHVRPVHADAFRGYVAYSAIHGSEQAKKIIENEKIVFERVAAFVEQHKVPCDFHKTSTFDVCLTTEFAEYEAQSLEAYRASGGDVSHVKVYHSEEAKARTKVQTAIDAYEWPAGSSHPAKLVQWMLSQLIADGVKLWTHCPVTAVEEHGTSDNSEARWCVKTWRGNVAAHTVIHCTNAFSASILPELSNFVTPNKAQAHSFIPGSSLSGKNVMRSTMSLRYSLRHFFSVIQRQSDGTVIFGISRGNPDFSEKTTAEVVSFDDTNYNDEIAKISRRELEKIFDGGGCATGKQARHGEGADHFWSGIIGMTPDSVPLVGAVPGKQGQWICAGFNGHGMARIFTCAPGLVKLIHGKDWRETGLPECFEISRERLKRTQGSNIKSVW